MNTSIHASATENFADLLNEYSFSAPGPFDVVTGVVTSEERNGFRVDIGGKSESICPHEEAADIKVGDRASFVVLGLAAGFGRIGEFEETAVRLSRRRIKSAETLTAMQEKGEIGQAYVVDVNRDRNKREVGLNISIAGTQGFVPGAEIKRMPGMYQFREFVGKTIPVKVVLLQKAHGVASKAVFSHAAAVRDLTKEVLSGLKPQQEVDAVVVRHSTTEEGKIVGAVLSIHPVVNGFVSNSQVSYNRDRKITEALPLGAKVKATVLEVNAEAGTLKLSTKKATIPWDAVNAVKVGDVMEGEVFYIVERHDQRTNATYQSQLLVRLANGLVGAVFHSDVTPRSQVAIGDRCPIGSKVVGKVKDVDTKNGRISLELSPMRDPILDSLAAAKGEVVEGVVQAEADFGYFISFGGIVDGLCHNHKLKKDGDTTERFTRGQVVKVRVEHVSNGDVRTVSLSRKDVQD